MCNHWCCYCCCNALLLLTFWLCALSYATHISRCFPFIFLRSSVPRVIHAARAQPPNPSANHCTTPPTKPPTTHRLPRCTAFMSSGYVALHAHKGRRFGGGVGLKRGGSTTTTERCVKFDFILDKEMLLLLFYSTHSNYAYGFLCARNFGKFIEVLSHRFAE